MRKNIFLTISVMVVALGLLAFSAYGQGKNLRAQLLENEGKTFKSTEDPDYQSYDQVLRDYVAKRIQKRYGLTLDPKAFSGYDLLEIEAYLKCKKPDESIDPYLQKLRKHS